jgi:hypothetical protein
MVKILSALICTVLSVSVFAQFDLRDYDTIPIRKPTGHKLIYEFSNRFFRVISINRGKVVAEGNYQSLWEEALFPINSILPPWYLILLGGAGRLICIREEQQEMTCLERQTGKQLKYLKISKVTGNLVHWD